MKTTIHPQSVENQRICGKLVEREVFHNVSMLVSHFANDEGALHGSSYSWEDDILPLCEIRDYEEAAAEEGWEQFEDEYGGNCYRDTNDGQTWACESWEELCRQFDIEPHIREAYEHWIVSDFLADELRERGEAVGELFNLTIWGRTTTGQAILLDGVIGQIAMDMEILKGQKHAW